jgi:L-fucose isomerase
MSQFSYYLIIRKLKLKQIYYILKDWLNLNVGYKNVKLCCNRTNKTWPTTWFVPNIGGKGPFRDVYSVMANWGANHGAFGYGHFGDQLITLASMLRIPVCMHNIEEERVFRPSAWSAFGMDAEGSDYRACAAYGPVYK